MGFIHCSFATQVETVANLFYRDRDDVLLLTIDPEQLTSPLRVEAVVGTGQEFPHIYGPLPAGAVTRVSPVPVRSDGHLDFGDLLVP